MNPDETYNDKKFHQEEVDNFFDISIIVVLSTKLYYVASELLFGYLYIEKDHASHFNFVICPYFQNEQLLPLLNRHGVRGIFQHLLSREKWWDHYRRNKPMDSQDFSQINSQLYWCSLVIIAVKIKSSYHPEQHQKYHIHATIR